MPGHRTGALVTNCATSTLATSLFPDRVNENPFFTEGPRRIFAHLLTFRPTAEELASWLCHDEELDRRVQGTPYASIIDRQAPAQRSGVLAALNMVADTLKLLPRESETNRRWSAVSWARDRRGWLFLTSTPEHGHVSSRSPACGSTCWCCG